MENQGMKEIARYLQVLLSGDFRDELRVDVFTPCQQDVVDALLRLKENLCQANDIANDIADGVLENEYKTLGNSFAAPLKSIQGNLRHLSWVAKQVAAGDYRQRISNMGALTDAFTEMSDQLQEYSRRVEEQLSTDYLTQLGNRRYFYTYANELWEQKRVFTIAYIDLDELKKCNDTYGHSEGDQYLIQIAQTLKALTKEDEEVFRIGGDEFVLISLVEDEKQLFLRLEDMRQFGLEHLTRKGEYVIDFSIGCVTVDYENYDSLSEYLTLADSRMYNNKTSHYLQRANREEIVVSKGAKLDHTGLESRIFEIFANTTKNRYVFICNMETNVSRWSTQAVYDFDLPGEYMYDAGSIWEQCIHPEDREVYRVDLQSVLSGRKKFHNIEYRAKNRDGNYVICSCSGTLSKGVEGKPDLFAGTITNHGIVDNIDPITNLYNVYEFLKQLARLKRERKKITIMAIGIYQFSDINLRYGYAVGNQVLQEFAHGLQHLIHGKGQLFRLDGVKFAYLLGENEDCDLEEIYDAATLVARNDILVEERHIPMEISGASLTFDYVDVKVGTIYSELIHALGRSKEESRGKLKCHSAIQGEKLHQDMYLFDTLLKSIINDCHGFYMVYQPQVNGEGQCIGVESLLRWKNEAFGIVPPGAYIPFLEKHPSFYSLGLWILRTSIRQMKPYVQFYPDFKVSVNISYRQIEHYGFRDDIMRILSEENFPAKNLTLELTEHCQSIDPKILQQDIAFFQAQGINISADDFGTGYSSFSLLKQLTFDCIKIDRSFILHILEDEGDQIMVEAVVLCAKKLGIRVCVEGVEEAEMVGLLDGYGADYYQGYYFARPLELAQLHEFVMNSQARL